MLVEHVADAESAGEGDLPGQLLIEHLAEVDILALEFNHDVYLEETSGRSSQLIARVLGNQGRVHHLMAEHALGKIESVYGSVFEGILGERVSTKPVEIKTPLPWVKK